MLQLYCLLHLQHPGTIAIHSNIKCFQVWRPAIDQFGARKREGIDNQLVKDVSIDCHKHGQNPCETSVDLQNLGKKLKNQPGYHVDEAFSKSVFHHQKIYHHL